MKVINTYSFKNGEKFIRSNHPQELDEILEEIESLNAVGCLTKESEEKTKEKELLISPTAMNESLKIALHAKGWTEKANTKAKKIFKEPRYNFGSRRYREMDGLKNKVGLEIQFGKYAFMGYDIFSKMIIFKNLGFIECGIEVVPTKELTSWMSTGVSSIDQLLVDLEYRGESNIDIPVYIIGIGLTDDEKKEGAELRELFKNDRKNFTKRLRRNSGSRPGPK